MASSLPFNTVKKSSSTLVSSANFANGTGRVFLTGTDIRPVSTADGKKHYVRFALEVKAQFVGYGNLTDLKSAVTTGFTGTTDDIELLLDGSSIYSGRGILSSRYNASQHVTEFRIEFDSEIPEST